MDYEPSYAPICSQIEECRSDQRFASQLKANGKAWHLGKVWNSVGSSRGLEGRGNRHRRCLVTSSPVLPTGHTLIGKSLRLTIAESAPGVIAACSWPGRTNVEPAICVQNKSHSYRSATIGSTRVAQREGMAHATTPTSRTKIATVANVQGSVAETPQI